MSVPAVLVLADDRTGALETAAALADRGLDVAFVPWGSDPPGAAVVVRDLGTRHLGGAEAAARAGAAEVTGDGAGAERRAHKIDSTLRGNWAAEVAARLAAAPGWRAAVVAAFPAAGRTCTGGVVFDGDRPVADGPAGRDPRAPVATSRPADLLAAAGVGAVAHAPDAAALDAWLAAGWDAASNGPRVVVVDAADDGALGERCARLAGAPGVLLAGTAAAVAAWAAPHAAPLPPSVGPSLPRPVLVVRGSRHPAAVEQVRRLREGGLVDGDAIVVCEAPAGDGDGDPAEVLEALAHRVRAVRSDRPPATLVLLGGDTAAAVLGDEPLRVEGGAGTGVARCRTVDDDLLVLTRPGGFGDPDALVTLLGPA